MVTPEPLSRRRFVQAAGATLAAGSAALLAACGDDDGGATDEAGDVRILNRVLAYQQGLLAAYTATLPLFKGPNLATARLFAKQEREHVSALATAIGDLGGSPVAARSRQQYAQILGLGELKSEAAAITLLAELEQGATYICVNSVASVTNHDLRATTAELAANAAQHTAVFVGIQTGNDPAKQSPAALARGTKPTTELAPA